MSGVDRVIRLSTAAAVVGVAGIAAYVSYWHAYEVVRAHGEAGITARLEPATIDGLVYSSSMVVLYAARHRVRVPGLARWLLALGIVATLAANMAHGWVHGPIGAAVAAWPAASLVGSYELLLWLIRTAGADREPSAGQEGNLSCGSEGERLVLSGSSGTCRSVINGSAPFGGPGRAAGAYRLPGPAVPEPDHGSKPGGPGPVQDRCADQAADNWAVRPAVGADDESRGRDIEVAAVAAYLASLRQGMPLSERRLAAMFGKTSRRWSRKRMAEARQSDLALVSSK